MAFGWKILCRHYKIDFDIQKKEEMNDRRSYTHPKVVPEAFLMSVHNTRNKFDMTFDVCSFVGFKLQS